jgi:probable non-F420 flavinoid oxidoreductase
MDRAIAAAGRSFRQVMQGMPIIGFHASHEQIDPRSLLDAVQAAEAAGFQAAMCSDHFSPWSTRQGESGFAWSWLGAALQATSLSFGVVNAPGQRYHPAIIAQAAATLSQMFPGRFWVALGSGEAMNEHITGDRWPVKSLRNARLRECVDVMRALFAGETVSHSGLVQVDRARLWTRPATPPPLIGAAVSEATAAWVGDWADGLVTINQPKDKLERMVAAFREKGGEARASLCSCRSMSLMAATRRLRLPSPMINGGPMSSRRRSAGISNSPRCLRPRRNLYALRISGVPF